jgi:regulator of protease activity HflC (stomatin/prohibitin superfamily)
MDLGNMVLLILGAIVIILVLGVFFGSFFTVEQAHSGIVQRLGSFRASPGPD